MATIAGRVFDNGTNNGIAGATIVASDRSPASRRIRYIGTTGNDGIYRIDNLPNSIFEIRTTHPNYVANKIGSVIIDLTGTNDALGINIPLKPKKPPTPTHTPTPTPTPTGGRGTIYGKVIDKRTKKIISGVTIAINAPNVPLTYSDDGGEYETYDLPEGRRYTVVATIEGYKRSIKTSPEVRGRTELNFELESEKSPAGIKGGMPILTGKWWEENVWRIVRAYAITLFVYFVFYRPIIITGLGITPDPFPPWFFINIIVPFIGFPLVLFFTMPKNMTNLGDWGPFILAASVFAVTLGASYLPPFRFLGSSPTIKFGVPFILALITAYMANRDKDKGLGLTILHITSIMLLLGFILFGINLVTSGTFLNIETYLRPLDILQVVGVSQDTIDSMKDGVRNVLSFLQFKGAEQTKPEAKKFGGFEAIQLNFGSKYNDYLLPTLFARMDYTLPITVTNPNKEVETKLIVKDFNITDVFLNNKSDDRILCGGVTSDSNVKGKIELKNINPEEEKPAIIEFNNKTYCLPVVQDYQPSAQNPMFPVKFRLAFEDRNTGDKTGDCKEVCKDNGKNIVDDHNARYQLTPGEELDETGSRYVSSGNECECKVKRKHNVLDDLCFMNNDKATITLKSSYGFDVQGKGELILVKTESDRKLAPKPTITSSAGPLTVTTYFVSDAHIFEKNKPKTTVMFIQIDNDGEGNGFIKAVKVNNVAIGQKISLDGSNKISIDNCLPLPTIPVGKEGTTIVCKVFAPETDDDSIVTGSYKTLPVIVDVEYTYSESHSTTINVKKETIPEGVIDSEQIKELNRQFYPLPYYCPDQKVTDHGFNVDPLMVYNPDLSTIKPSDQASKFANYCSDKISKTSLTCKNSEGGCKNDSECNQIVIPALSCRDVGAEVKVCCTTTLTDAECKQNFENWKPTATLP